MKLMNQKELAERWCVAEATLERWRSIGAGPPYLKLVSQVRYRLSDVEAFEAAGLTTPTRPSRKMRSMPTQWSSTCSQSRTFMPSP